MLRTLSKRRESSKRNYYIISPRVIIKAIIIKFVRKNEMLALLAAALLVRWPQVGRVMITFE